MEGCTNRAWPISRFLKNCQNGPCMKLNLLGGQMTFFEVITDRNSVAISSQQVLHFDFEVTY